MPDERATTLLERSAIVLVGLPAATGYVPLAVATLMRVTAAMAVDGGSNSGNAPFYATLLELVGLFALPAGLVIALVFSFIPIRLRIKKLLWMLTAGGILAWFLAGWMLDAYWQGGM